ncbi:hypothetical protein NQ314_011890 [Rhamnusium bicolor]|uniref:Uncharacterized protein n=1 Tax=Rhamnusium bicolor TaxID=1586634 RepID=A0AAV8XFS5_9CUCU|nr:hypothetical protein NQ314_011890 [Rhamnusium bicolor]
MTLMTNEGDTIAEIQKEQETHITLQVALNTELLKIQKQLVIKESLAQRLATNNQYMVDYHALTENEAKIALLQKEKDELLQQLKTIQTEQRQKRVQELEAQLHDLRKKGD